MYVLFVAVEDIFLHQSILLLMFPHWVAVLVVVVLVLVQLPLVQRRIIVKPMFLSILLLLYTTIVKAKAVVKVEAEVKVEAKVKGVVVILEESEIVVESMMNVKKKYGTIRYKVVMVMVVVHHFLLFHVV
jgi:hypothetical protein